jgi:hypothetical protein
MQTVNHHVRHTDIIVHWQILPLPFICCCEQPDVEGNVFRDFCKKAS